jgi:uncharacterized protein (DUF2267 family)
MSGATERETLDVTLQKTNVWLNEIMVLLGIEDRHLALTALRAGLHSLRDRDRVAEAAQLGAQLPMLIRGLYYEGWRPMDKPLRLRHLDDFLERLQRELPGRAGIVFDAEQVARTVFRVLARHLSHGETASVQHILPRPLAGLWPPVAGVESGG